MVRNGLFSHLGRWSGYLENTTFSWWKTMGSMKHFPPVWVKTSKLHQNGDHYTFCTFHIHYSRSNFQVHTTLFQFWFISNPISSQFHTCMALSLIPLTPDGMMICFSKVGFFILTPLFFHYVKNWLACILIDILVRSIASFLNNCFLML